MRPLRVLAVSLGAAVTIGALGRRWLDTVEVRGESMAPTLLPGELLLVERLTFRRRWPRTGEIVLAADPRRPEREIVKRIAGVDPVAGEVELRGDAPQQSTDSRSFGSLPRREIRWRVALRYWPPRRIGRP